MKDKLLIIDGNSLINRAYYALPFLTNNKGQFTGAVYGFVNMFVKIVQDENPTHAVVAFDHARKTFRNEIYEDYKGTRKGMPEELRQQMPLIKEVLDTMGIARYEQNGIEADDIIGTIAKTIDVQKIILSGDKDIFQVIDKNSTVIFPKKGITQTQVVTVDTIKEMFGYNPEDVVDLKALMGDSSDNIPGVRGVGPKTALNLLDKYKTLDGVYENLSEIKGSLHDKLEASKDIAYMSQKLARIKTDCNLEGFSLNQAKLNFPFALNVYEMFEELEFKSLIKRSELFAVQAKTIKKSKETRVEIKTEQDLNVFVKGVKKSKQMAFNFDGKLEFAYSEDKTFFIPLEIDLFSTIIDIDKTLEVLKDVLEDESILKLTYNLKTHLHLFNKHSISLKGKVFDFAIADYLINAGSRYKAEQVGACKFFEKYSESKGALKDLELTDLYYNIELPLAYILYDMEKSGFKIDSNQLDELAQKYNAELENLTQEIYKEAEEEFNVNSPKQLSGILFDKLGLNVYGNKKRSTNIEVLNSLEGKHPIISLIIRYRKLFKLTTTYVHSYQKIVADTGDVIHTVFNQTLTATGRLSSSEPNLQNIPVRDDEGKNLRKLFISKFTDGVLVAADYSQIELRLLANFSGDENMIDAYRRGVDIHTRTASQIFGVPENEVSSNMRRDAKAVNFGIVYGISDFGLSNNIGSTVGMAKAYINKYFETYPKVKEYMQKNVDDAKENGLIRTMYGRIRKIPEIKASNYQLRQFGERVAMNMPLQGSASDIIKLAMIKVYNKLKEQNLQSKVILQIHDELIIDTKPEEQERVEQLLKECMENTTQLQIPLTVQVASGKTWFECK